MTASRRLTLTGGTAVDAAAPTPTRPASTGRKRTPRSTDGAGWADARRAADLDSTVTDIRLRLARTQPRSTDMHASQHLLNEQLARHRWHEMSTEAQRSRLLRAVRADRRARRAQQSAQRAVQSARHAAQAARVAAEQLV